MDWLRDRAKATPNKLALIFEDHSWTYAELDGMTNDVCGQLVEAGAKAGQLVAMLMEASETAVALVHAVARLQMTLVPLNLRLTPVEQAWQLEKTQADWVVGIGDLGTGDRKPTAYKTLILKKPQLPTTNYQLPISDLRSPISDHPQAIVFTSGTTGNPKGAMLTFENHFWSANASAYRLGVNPDDRWVSCLPLYHVGGLAVIFRSCLYGTAVILHQKFDLDAINHSLDIHGGTMISVVPTMLYRLLESRDFWPDTLRLILVGGAAASPELVEQANGLPRQSRANSQRSTVNSQQSTVNNQQTTERGQRKIVDGRLKIENEVTLIPSLQPPAPNPQSPNLPVPQPPPIVSTTYGLTESASQVATQTPEDTARKPGSVGKPLMFCSVRVVDDNGRSLPTNEIGEIVVSGPMVMQGYFANETATAKTIKNGELYTGDVGYLDEDGDLWLVQRRSDIIVSGGENVYPAEVEKVFKAHPAIKALCVVGVPNAEWGQIVAAMVVLEDGHTLTEAELLDYGRKQLAGYKQPRVIKFVSALPLTGSGKIARQQVKEGLGVRS